MNPAVNQKLEALRRQLSEGQSDGTASVEMTTEDLLRCVENAFWGPPGQLQPLGDENAPMKALKALEALGKLDFNKAELAACREYFEHMAEAAIIRQKASRAIGKLREEFWDDRDDKEQSRYSMTVSKRG